MNYSSAAKAGSAQQRSNSGKKKHVQPPQRPQQQQQQQQQSLTLSRLGRMLAFAQEKRKVSPVAGIIQLKKKERITNNVMSGSTMGLALVGQTVCLNTLVLVGLLQL